jgi:hypothetical protein
MTTCVHGWIGPVDRCDSASGEVVSADLSNDFVDNLPEPGTVEWWLRGGAVRTLLSVGSRTPTLEAVRGTWAGVEPHWWNPQYHDLSEVA